MPGSSSRRSTPMGGVDRGEGVAASTAWCKWAEGIAAAMHGDRPTPLPAQALDHGTGYLLAAAVCRALTLRARSGRASTVRGTLLGAANHLFSLGFTPPAPTSLRHRPPRGPMAYSRRRRRLGARHAVFAAQGAIEGCPSPSWHRMAGPLGTWKLADGRFSLAMISGRAREPARSRRTPQASFRRPRSPSPSRAAQDLRSFGRRQRPGPRRFRRSRSRANPLGRRPREGRCPKSRCSSRHRGSRCTY